MDANAKYEVPVEINVRVLFTGTVDQFNNLTRVELREEAIATVKALLPGLITSDPTFEIEVGSGFHENYFSPEQLADERDWVRKPGSRLVASLPEPQGMVEEVTE